MNKPSHGFKMIFPDTAMNRQVSLSIENTLGQRRCFGKFTIFLHGDDRSYPHSTLHQSYPMHLAALACGQDQDVAGELRAYASLQPESGAMDYRIGQKGPMIYFSHYTEAMFLLCLYQYVQWSGDRAFLSEFVENDETHRKAFFWYRRYKGFSGTMLEHAMRAADFTLSRLYKGCVPCMDWHDALPANSPAFKYFYQKASFYPPKIEMKAAAQGTFVWCDALEKLAALCSGTGQSAAGARYLHAAKTMRKKAKDIFYNNTTGVYAELIDGKGRRYFDRKNDFWSYPQIRAIAVGLEQGTRLLNIVLQHRGGKFGITICARPHFAVTYNTLLLWPENTMLLALEYARQGDPDAALRVIKGILPEHLHRHNPKAPNDHWTETYDPITAEPYGVTCGGDPELVHACLEGFCGITVVNGRVQMSPQLPGCWKNRSVSCAFHALGRYHDITLS